MQLDLHRARNTSCLAICPKIYPRWKSSLQGTNTDGSYNNDSWGDGQNPSVVSQDLFLHYVNDCLLVSKTELDYKRVTEKLPQELLTLGSRMLGRKLSFVQQRLPVLASSWGLEKGSCLRGWLPAFWFYLQRLKTAVSLSSCLRVWLSLGTSFLGNKNPSTYKPEGGGGWGALSL
jgi:hypothetical protein